MPAENPAAPGSGSRVRCCIAGGGPAGMMLGLLLARAGVQTTVLEKHADFLRDFRGDTVHPSTLDVMYELGLLDEFLRRPHQQITELFGQIGDERVTLADFSRVPTHCKFIALMPQWDFLDLLASHAKRYSTFDLRMQAEATALLESDGRVIGVTAKTQAGTEDIHAELVIGADGRHSTVRACAGLAVDNLGAPMDVLWMRLSRQEDDPPQTLGRIDAGRILVMLQRGDYWQCAYVIPKGGFEEIRERGLPAFREDIARLVPYMRERVNELADWDQIKELTVAVDRLRQWYRPGLLCIGDAAHAMSPIGGVGINLAIQDAVAAANILAPRFLQGAVGVGDLRAVQARREFPTRVTQRVQLLAQDRIVSRVLAKSGRIGVAWPFRMLNRWKLLRGLPARLVGVGVRPEHVATPDILA
ncbi:MAG: FAD-dependent oxidoreductase [Rhodospirillales bacterium]